MGEIDKLGVQIVEWKKRSERREICGIFGCENEPKVYCPNCGNWYCEEHKFIHFHAIYKNN